MRSLKTAWPLLRPLWKLLSANMENIEDALATIDELERMANELATLPDRFNDLFAPRGWVIYSLMNMEIVKAAVEKAEAGKIDEAEGDLLRYYDAETVQWQLRMMNGVQASVRECPLPKRPSSITVKNGIMRAFRLYSRSWMD